MGQLAVSVCVHAPTLVNKFRFYHAPLICMYVYENYRETAEMNERNNIALIQNKKWIQLMLLGLDSVALRHTLVYVWETLINSVIKYSVFYYVH